MSAAAPRPRRPGRAGCALALCLALGLLCAVLAGPREGRRPEEGQAAGCRRTLVGVAHPDDDLLFINPEVQRTVRLGCFVSTVYLTAGDDGTSFTHSYYARSREDGIREAYARMAGAADRWTRDDLEAGGPGRRRVVSYTLDGGAADVRLTFLRLPDGFPRGRGSPAHGRQSLLRLFRGTIARIDPVDGSPGYTEAELLDTLSELARRGGVGRILTLDYDNVSFRRGHASAVDHSDHGVTGRYFRRVALGAPGHPEPVSYLGYNTSVLRPNLTPAQRRGKEAVFRSYLRHQGCLPRRCPSTHALGVGYRVWVRREYARTHREPRAGEIMSGIGAADVALAPGRVERCLDAAGGGERGVGTRVCDGSRSQAWSFSGSGPVRSQGPDGLCLTASAGITLAVCDGSAGQLWRGGADGSLASAGGCLFQDDLARAHPRLTLGPCAPLRPELRWKWRR